MAQADEEDGVMVDAAGDATWTEDGEPVEACWFNLANPQPPKSVRDLALAVCGADIPVGLVAWAALGQRALGLLTVLRGMCHVAKHRLADDERKTKWAVGTWAGYVVLSRLLYRLQGTGPRSERAMRWLCALLGHAQIVIWGACNPDSLVGVGVRHAWLALTSGWAIACKRLGLEGGPLFARRQFPAAADEISTAWVAGQLEAHPLLKGQHPFAVANISVTPLSAGAEAESGAERPQGFIGETVRVHLAYEGEAQDNPLLPRSVVAKLPTRDEAIKCKMRSIALYMREVRFYKEVAPKLRRWEPSRGIMLQVPRTYAECYDDRTADFCLLMQDAQPMVPGNEIHGATWQQACSVAVRYARFHSIHWSRSLRELDDKHNLGWHRCFDWMNLNETVVDLLVHTAFHKMMQQERFARLVNADTQRLLRTFLENLPLVLDELKSGPLTLIHADCRMENMLWPAQVGQEDRVCHAGLAFDDLYERRGIKWLSIDWQTSTKGTGVYDLAYFASIDLEVDPQAGARCDRLLVERYYATLAENLPENTLAAYGPDQCWRDYRLSMLLATLIPIAVMQPESIGSEGLVRAQAVREAMLARSVRALVRVDAAAVLDEVLRERLDQRYMSGQLATYRLVEDHVLGPDSEEDPASHGAQDEAPVMLCSATAKDERLAHITRSLFNSLPEGFGPAPGTGRRDCYDRWFLNGYDRRGRVFFAAALGVYPGRGVVDASFSIVLDGVQHNVRASRRLAAREWPAEDSSKVGDLACAAESKVGPISIVVLEPLRRVQLEVHVPGRIEANLTFHARYAPTMEPPYNVSLGSVGSFNYDRLTQLVSWDGFISVGDAHVDVIDWRGSRDRSWGTRPHPPADKSPRANWLRNAIVGQKQVRQHVINPLLRAPRCPQFYWLWTLVHFDHGAVTYHSQQDADGKLQNGAAHIFGDPFLSPGLATASAADGQRDDAANPFFPRARQVGASTSRAEGHAPFGRCEAAGHSVLYLPRTRHAQSATLVIALQDGRRVTLTFQPTGLPFFMSGIGYNHPTWGHGASHHFASDPECDLVMQIDALRTQMQDRARPENWHVQEMMQVTARLYEAQSAPDDAPLAEAVGVGALEQLSVGPHRPSQFASLYDVAA